MWGRIWGTQPSPAEIARREQIKARLVYSQYIGLAIAAEQFLFGSWAGVVVAVGVSTYLEKMAAYIYKNTLNDPDCARYLEDHYSHVTQLSNLFNPVIESLTAKANEDLQQARANKRMS